jgi:hypothetical protein
LDRNDNAGSPPASVRQESCYAKRFTSFRCYRGARFPAEQWPAAAERVKRLRQPSTVQTPDGSSVGGTVGDGRDNAWALAVCDRLLGVCGGQPATAMRPTASGCRRDRPTVARDDTFATQDSASGYLGVRDLFRRLACRSCGRNGHRIGEVTVD